jgi:hydrophobic/amphiphilic exporter-1 (mainly G- bacteria), HAE1 family
MWHFTKLALRNRWITLGVAIVVLGVSVWGFMGLKVELMPDISFPYETVLTIYPSASPDQVANEVSSPIEKAIWDNWSGKSLKHVTSTSSAGLSMVLAEFEFGTDMQAVDAKISGIVKALSLPEAVINLPKFTDTVKTNPQVIPININTMPLMQLSISGNLPQEQLSQIISSQIVPELGKIEGVLQVSLDGVGKDQLIISPDPLKMNLNSVSISQIAAVLGDSYKSIDDLNSTTVNQGGTKLSEVASVSNGLPPNSSIARVDGQPAINLSITKTEEANSVEVSARVDKELAKLLSGMPGITVTTVFNQADYINANVSQLEEKAILGAVIAMLVVFLFLLTVRGSLITAVSIPASMFIGFLCMKFTGITLNILTLSAMVIAIGRLIDDSIVMVEVIFRRMKSGENFKTAAIEGSREIAAPITTATLATVAIFLPLMFVGGIIGEMFIPFALTVTFAMLASLVVALMLIPALSGWLVSGKKDKNIKPAIVKDNWYQKAYTTTLKWALNHRAISIISAVVLLIASTGLLSVTGTSFMSGSMGEPSISIDIVLPPSGNSSDTAAVTTQVENLLAGNPEIRTFSSTIGTSASFAGMMSGSQGGDNKAKIIVYLKNDKELETQTAVITTTCQSIQSRASIVVSADSSGGMGGSTSNLELYVQGQDKEAIAAVAGQLLEKLKRLAGVADLSSDLTTVVPKLNISLDPAKIAAAGVPANQMPVLQQEFMLLTNGSSLPGKSINVDGSQYGVYIKGVTGSLANTADANSLRIGFPNSITLGSIANVELIEQPSHVSHTDTYLSATISGVITAKDVGSVNKVVQQAVDSLPVHPGVTVSTGGITETMNDSMSRMMFAILAAIVIVFIIVILMMRSLKNPLMIMVSIPLAFIGSMLALVITGQTLGVSAMIGLLMLVGIVLTNAIVLVAIVEQKRKTGMSIKDALMEGGKIRLRPIIMTALTTILAMIPMALSSSSGTMVSAELAIVVIGGMVTSTFLTLLIIPCIYSLVHKDKVKAAN